MTGATVLSVVFSPASSFLNHYLNMKDSHGPEANWDKEISVPEK